MPKNVGEVMKSIGVASSALCLLLVPVPCPAQGTTCEDCLAGTIVCNEPVRGRIEAGDCDFGANRHDEWRFELAARSRVLVELAASPFAAAFPSVSDAACGFVPSEECNFGGAIISCRYELEAGTYFIGAFAGFEGDYELSVDCGGVRALSCRPDAEGGVEVSWRSSPVNDPEAPISIRLNGVEAATVAGDVTRARLDPAALGALPDQVAEVCVVDSSGRAACCGVFLGEELAVNCGGLRLDAALGTGVGDGRVWLEDSAARPSPFLKTAGSTAVDFAALPGGFTTATTTLVEPEFTDDPARSRLFAFARTGPRDLTYRFGVSPGDWEVTLLFAECCASGGCLAIPDPTESPGPCRVFDVVLDDAVVESRFSPHVAVQRALANDLPNERYGAALASGPIRVSEASEIEVVLRDLGDGDPPGDPLLQGVFLRRIRPARFTLGFAGDACGAAVEGAARTVFETGLECTLTTADNPFAAGARAWSLSLGAEGGAITSITTAGTAGAPVSAGPPGLRQGGFEGSELTSGSGNEGAVSTVVLSFAEPVTLPPAGTAVVGRIEVEAPFPTADCTRRLTVFYVDGRRGSSGPIENLIDQLELTARPTLGGCAIDLRGLEAVLLQRGDANGDGDQDISDAITIVLHLFAGGLPLGCSDAADVDDDGTLSLTDAIALLVHLFRGGTAPPAPFPECGVDSTADPLGCERHDPCAEPPGSGECPPPPSGGPLLVRAAPEPFQFPLLRGLRGQSRLTVRNPNLAPLRVDAVAIDPRFDDELFSLDGIPTLPRTLAAGETLALAIAGLSRRLGLHRVDVRYRTERGEHVEAVLFEVALGSQPRIPAELSIVTLPGQPATGFLEIANGATAFADLEVALDGPPAAGPFSVDPAHFPLALRPGATFRLPVQLRFDAETPGSLGDGISAVLRLRSNGGLAKSGETGMLHIVVLKAKIVEGASFSGPLGIALGAEVTRTLLAQEAFRDAVFVVRSIDPRVVRLRDARGALVDEISSVRHGDPVTFVAVGPGVADIEIALEPPTGGGGQFGTIVPLRRLAVGLQRASTAAGTRAVRVLRGGAGNPDTVEILDLPGGSVVIRHEFPAGSILRGQDLVPAEVGGKSLGLLQVASGDTVVFDLADGSKVATVPSGGGTAVPGVDPATARVTVAGRERVFAIAADSLLNLVSFDVETGAVAGRVRLADFSAMGALGMGEDVDVLVHGRDGTAVPPAAFVMALNGECFAASLPALSTVTVLGKLDPGVRTAVDPVAMGPSLVSFQDAAGEVLFADRAGGGFRTYRRSPRLEPVAGGTVLFDSPLADVDIASTSDGRFGVQLAAYGHAYVLDQEKLDPLGSRAGQALVTLKAPFQALSVIGVDPRIARYDPASPTRERDARVLCAYNRDVARMFSLDGALQFTYEPVAGGAEAWERNIDILVGPPGAGGLEEHAVLRHGEGVIRVIDLATGRVLHTVIDPDRGRPVEGVDPRLTPDGRFLIDLQKDVDGKQAVVRIHGVHPSTFGVRRDVDADLGLPERDIDLILHESGQWAAVMDAAGRMTLFDLAGRMLGTVPAPAGAKAVLDVDIGIPWQPALTPDPDEDWVEPPAGTEPPPNPPPIIPPPPGPGTPIPPEADPEPENPDDDTEEGGGTCPGGTACLCDGENADLNDLLFDRIPELSTCPIGFPGFPGFKTSKVEVKSHSPLAACTTRRLQAIQFQGRLIPLDELKLGEPEDCGGFPDCGCEEEHWHAANGFDALATDGTRVRDPNPSQCGYGTVSEVRVVDLGEEVDCSGQVVTVDGSRLSTRAPGTAVIIVRPCVDPEAGPADLAKVKPIEVEVVVIRPKKLTAQLEAAPFTAKMVEKGSSEPMCLAAACGDEITFTAETCPPRCVGLLELGQSGGTFTGPCIFVEKPFQGAGGVDSVVFTVPEDPSDPIKCRIHPAVLKCKSSSRYELPPIDVHVIDLQAIEGPQEITQGDADSFNVEFCILSIDCRSDECDRADLLVQAASVIERAEFFIVDPDGTENRLDESGVEGRFAPPSTPGEDLPFVSVPFTAPDFPGDYTFRAKLGACTPLDFPFRVSFRSVADAIPSREQPDPRNQHTRGDPVYVHSGEHAYHAIDLMVPGRGLPFIWERIHRTQASYRGPQGNNWDHRYNERLEYEDTDADGDIDVRHFSMLYATVHERTGAGPLDYRVPDGQYKRLRRNPDGTFSLRFRDGEVHTFHGLGGLIAGRLKEITDRTGENRLRFEYDAQSQLTTIFDTYNRRYTLEHTLGRITKLRDFGGREVVFEYYGPLDAEGSDGDLKSVRSPIVAGTPNANDFPQGKTTRYTYLAGPIHPELRHNLLTITMPNEVARGGPPSVINTYGMDPEDPLTFDRVITQVEGGINHTGIAAGGPWQYYYEDVNAGADPLDLTVPRRRTVVVDRNGNVRTYLFNSRFQLIEERVHTGRVDPEVRFPHAIEARGPAVRAGFIAGEGRPGPDPDFYAHRYEVNRHGEVVRTTLPEGNSRERVYAFEDDANPLLRGDLTEERWIADPVRMTPGPGAATVRRRTFSYEPLTGSVASVTDARGHDPAHDGPDADQDPDGPERYRTRWLFDYQEIADTERVRSEAAAWGITIPADFPLGLGDLNGDGQEGPLYGQPVLQAQPAATVLAWDGASLVFGAPQEASALMRYNRYGQPTSDVDFEENTSEYVYYPATDPDGDGRDLIAGNDPDTGGYVRTVVHDTTAAPGRSSGRNPPPESRALHYRYNQNGYATEVTNGRGVTTAMVRNQLDQVVRAVQAASIDPAVQGAPRPEDALATPLGYVTDFFYDHNENVVRTETENRDSGTDAANPTFDADVEYDVLNRPVRRSVEVDAAVQAVWDLRYDPNENLVLARQPEGNETRSVFDERNLLFTVTTGADDPTVAATMTYAYDGNGNVRFTIDAEDTDGDGLPEATENSYDGWDRQRRVIDPAGQEVLTDYDAADQPVRRRVLGAAGGPTPTRGDGSALELLRDDRSHFDERGRLIRTDWMLFGPFAPGLETVEGPLTPGGGDASAVFEVDRLSRLVRAVDDRGNDALTGYNGVGEVIVRETAAVDGRRSRLEVARDRAGNPFRRLETEMLPGGGSEQFESLFLYDAANRLVRSTDPLGQTSYLAYDSRGDLTVGSDAKGPLLGGDPTGATALDINGTGNTARSITDGLGRVVARFTDLRPGGAGDGTPSFAAPPDPAAAPAGLEGTAANPDGVIAERYTYDLNSRLTAYEDDRGAITRFAYDALDRRTVQEHADGSRWTFTYDRDGNVRRLDDPRGAVTRFAYDALERHVRTDIDRGAAPAVAGSAVLRQELDGLGRVTRVVDENDPADPGDDHTVEIEHDSLDNPLREVEDGVPVERRWDSTGNRLATVYPGGGRTLEARYDALDRCGVLAIAGGIAVDLCRTEYAGPSLRRVREALGNGLETRYRYDAKRRLESMETTSGASTLTGRAYAYDRADLRVSERWLERLVEGGQEGRTFAVDSQGRFVAARPAVLDAGEETVAVAPLAESFRWLLDGVGNWVEYQTPERGRAGEFNVLNQDIAHGHDASGNRTADDRRRHVFDCLNRLIAVHDAASGELLESYTYDGLNRRATRTVTQGDGSRAVTRFIYDGAHVIEERRGAAVTARNYYLPQVMDGLVARETPAVGLTWRHTDIVGSTTAVTDAAGRVLEHYEYAPFGEARFLGPDFQPLLDAQAQPLRESSIENPYLFCGRRLDATGLYHFRNRYLDPEHGRFLSRDLGLDPLHAGNLYSYGGLNPLVYIDPWGSASRKIYLPGGARDPGAELIYGYYDGMTDRIADLLWSSPVGWSIRFSLWPEQTIAETTGYWKEKVSSIKAFFEDPGTAIDNFLNPKGPVDWGQRGNRLGGSTIDGALGGVASALTAPLRAASSGGRAADALTDARAASSGAKSTRVRATSQGRTPQPSPGQGGVPNCGMCFVAGTKVETPAGPRAIESLRVGERVASKETADAPPPLAAGEGWRILEVVVTDPDDPTHLYRFTLLRPPVWLARWHDDEKGLAWVESAELGVAAWGRVAKIGDAGDIAPGPGRLITATVVHLNTDVHELSFAGCAEILRPTGYHPFYSLDRRDWVAARDLRPGERVEAGDGAATVASVRLIPGEYRVYNLEVEGTHTYFAGACGVYVHNSGTCRTGKAPGGLEPTQANRPAGLERTQVSRPGTSQGPSSPGALPTGASGGARGSFRDAMDLARGGPESRGKLEGFLQEQARTRGRGFLEGIREHARAERQALRQQRQFDPNMETSMGFGGWRLPPDAKAAQLALWEVEMAVDKMLGP
ncbi:MAG: hypothetical protein HY721_22245 [Planctomycetes bacterium]|nr:hypothetical protein [Planctomycetota bacterium]